MGVPGREENVQPQPKDHRLSLKLLSLPLPEMTTRDSTHSPALPCTRTAGHLSRSRLEKAQAASMILLDPDPGSLPPSSSLIGASP